MTDRGAKALARGVLGDLRGQPRLTDARAAPQEHDCALAAAGAVDQAAQQRGFPLPPDKRRLWTRRRPGAVPHAHGS